VQYTAPYTHAGGGPGGWGSAMVSVPLEFYQRFGDIKPMESMYPQMWEYLRYLDDHSVNGLVASDREGEWCLGEWVTPDPVALPAPFVNNYFYIKSCERMIMIARLIGKEDDIPELERRISDRKRVTEAAYFNSWDGNFIGNLQGANAFAVDIGIGDKRTLTNLIKRYDSIGYYDTGIFGTEIVTRILFENGRPDLAVRLLTADTPHGFGRFKNEGLTTIPEYWGSISRSLCHPMFGAVAAHLFDYILGIRHADGSTGYEKVVIKPLALGTVRNASGYLTAKNGGRIAVDIKDGTVTVTLPEGVSGVFVNGDKTTDLAVGENVITL
jgi:alpha-L-rhamnosidase